jgi:regulator of sigma E protease
LEGSEELFYEDILSHNGFSAFVMVFSIIIGIIIFCLIITIHEFGHFISARLCGITVKEFAIGMGPKLFGKKGKKTDFSVRVFPIGGYCDMSEDSTDTTDPNHFRNKPLWMRFITIAAGAIMNLALGFVLCLIITGGNKTFGTTTIAYLEDNAFGSSYGLEIGDKITKIDGRTMHSDRDIIYILSTDEDGIVDMTVKRGNEKINLENVKFDLTIDPATGQRTLNYDFKVRGVPVTIANIIPYSANTFDYMGKIVIYSLIDLIRGKYGLNDLSGPVGIVDAVVGYTQDFGIDPLFLLDIAALITINVGIFNLLPLPALDGGRLLFLIIEFITRKPVKAEIEGGFHLVGMAALMLLMLVVTAKDIMGLFAG